MKGTDDVEFADFVRARSAGLFKTALLLTGDRAAAEDLVQSTLERAYLKWGSVASAQSPEAYVRRILVNLTTDRWRRRRWVVEHELDAEPPARSDPYAAADTRDALIRALRSLPIGMRTIVVLRYFDDQPAAAIAEALGLSPGTVKSQTARGLAKLRVALTGGADNVDHLSPGGPA